MTRLFKNNEGISIIRCQLAAWVPDKFCNFYKVKNLKFANNLMTANAREIWNP